MSHRNNRSALLASTMLIGVAMPGLAAAQDGDDQIIVTGSRIPQANAISASPVTTIGNVEFDIRGQSRVEDLINTLPQSFAAQGSNTSNGASGTAQVDLRGLGPNRTLVLVDGRRLPYGSPISSAPDLNQVPGALVERVEVLTGGASAAYGSDAIAGVVNFIMIDDFEGIRFDGQLGAYQHSNSDNDAQTRLANSSFDIPESNVFDGKSQDFTIIMGANTDDGRGNVTAYFGYRNNDAILQADRDYSACSYGGGLITAARPLGFACSGSATTPNGTFVSNFGTFTLDEAGPGNTFRPTDAFTNNLSVDLFNYAPTNFYQRPDERYTLGAFGKYEVNENLEFYTQLMFMNYKSDAQIAFSGSFFVPTSINCANPLISAAQLPLICSPAQIAAAGADDTDPAGNTLLYNGKRLVEGAPRNSVFDTTMYRGVFGLRGDIMDGWTYDAYFQYQATLANARYENDVSTTRLLAALDVVDVGGVPTCRSVRDGTDATGCIPLNIFEIGGVTTAQAAYVSVPSFQDGGTEQYIAEGVVTGDLGVYGMQSPYAEEGIGIAAGVQWRKDVLDFNPDTLFISGDLAGQGGTSPPTFGIIETTDLFVEAQFPIVTGMPFAERFAINGGYRHSDVSTSGGNDTWKLTGDWQVTPDIRVRGGWQRAVRSANVIESFTPQLTGLTTLPRLANGQSDPCAGPTPFATLAACMNTGVTAAQYGSIAGSPARQYNGVFGGNPNLVPESSDTYTAGVVLTPTMVPGNLLFSVDYFNISVDSFISAVAANVTMNQCLTTGAANVTTSSGTVIPICDAIFRSGSGNLFLGNNFPGGTSGYFQSININTGDLSTEGLDINGNWALDLGEVGLDGAGGLNIDLIATYLLSHEVIPLPGLPVIECEGTYGEAQCNNAPLPKWRHKLRVTWETPVGVDATVSWRRIGSVDLQNPLGAAANDPLDLDSSLSTENYIDLAASYNILENWNVRVGVNNVMDNDPPLTTQTAGFSNGNTYPQTYDAQGRFLFIGTTVDF